MKLILSSNGFSNESIADAVEKLVGKPLTETTIVFVPTASNIETDDKSWVIEDLQNIKKQGFKNILITDISAVPEKVWRPQFEEADVLFFEGGNTYHLMRSIRASGLEKLLPEFLKTKVYMGLSAGSMVTGPELALNLSRVIYGEYAENDLMQGLGLVDFYFLPHLNSPHFQDRIEANLETAMKEVTKKTYVLDDQSALVVEDGVVTHVGGGKYLEFN